MATVLKRSVPAAVKPTSLSYEALLQELLAQDQEPAPGLDPQQVTQNLDRNDQMVQLGLAGSMASDLGTAPVGASVFKQALSDRQNKITARGSYDPLRGTTIEDPLHAQERQDNRRDRILKLTMAHEDMQQRAAAQEEEKRRHEEFLREMQADRYARMTSLKQTAPAVKPPAPVKMSNFDSKDLSTYQQELANIETSLKLGAENPNAFGFTKGIPEAPGGQLAQALMSQRDKRMKPSELTARSRIFNGVSAVIKERAGTAQSRGEQQRLNGFLPGPYDDWPVVEQKVRAYGDYLREKAAIIESRYKPPTDPLPVDEAVTTQPMNPAARDPVAPAPVQPRVRKVQSTRTLPNGSVITIYEPD